MSSDVLVLVLVAPDTRKKVAGITLDLFKVATGRTLQDLLSRVLIDEPVAHTNTDTGAQEVQYTIGIPAQTGVAIPFRPVGELGIAHVRDGVLSITCPKALNAIFTELLGRADIQTSEPEDVAHQDGGVMTQFFVRTKADMHWTLPLPKIGSIQVIRP